MYEYKETLSQPDISKLKINNTDIEIQLDEFPIQRPFIPRIDGRQAHLFLWLGKKEDDIETYNLAEKNIGEKMWVHNKTPNTFIKGVGMFHIYDEYVIVGSLKYPGYMRSKSPVERRRLIRTMWCETINIFKGRRILCPTGTYFDYLHLSMNQMKAQKEPYHREIMQQFGFEKDVLYDHFWIRDKDTKTGLNWIELYGD